MIISESKRYDEHDIDIPLSPSDPEADPPPPYEELLSQLAVPPPPSPTVSDVPSQRDVRSRSARVPPRVQRRDSTPTPTPRPGGAAQRVPQGQGQGGARGSSTLSPNGIPSRARTPSSAASASPSISRAQSYASLQLQSPALTPSTSTSTFTNGTSISINGTRPTPTPTPLKLSNKPLTPTQSRIRDTVVQLLRILVADHCSPDASSSNNNNDDNNKIGLGILQGCVGSCAAYQISFSSLLLLRFIGGHSPLYWVIVKNAPASLPSLSSTPESQPAKDGLFRSIFACVDRPLMVDAQRELRRALLKANSHVLWREVLACEQVKGAEKVLLDLDAKGVPDDVRVEIHASSSAQAPLDSSFSVHLRLEQFAQRLTTFKRVETTFLAFNRAWKIVLGDDKILELELLEDSGDALVMAELAVFSPRSMRRVGEVTPFSEIGAGGASSSSSSSSPTPPPVPPRGEKEIPAFFLPPSEPAPPYSLVHQHRHQNQHQHHHSRTQSSSLPPEIPSISYNGNSINNPRPLSSSSILSIDPNRSQGFRLPPSSTPSPSPAAVHTHPPSIPTASASSSTGTPGRRAVPSPPEPLYTISLPSSSSSSSSSSKHIHPLLAPPSLPIRKTSLKHANPTIRDLLPKIEEELKELEHVQRKCTVGANGIKDKDKDKVSEDGETAGNEDDEDVDVKDGRKRRKEREKGRLVATSEYAFQPDISDGYFRARLDVKFVEKMEGKGGCIIC